MEYSRREQEITHLHSNPPVWQQIWYLVRGLCCLPPRPEEYNPLYKVDELQFVQPPVKGDQFPMCHPIPAREMMEWSATVKRRYTRQIFCCSPVTWASACCCERTEKIHDKEFEDLYNHTILSTFLNPTLDPKDLADFKDFLPSNYAQIQQKRKDKPAVMDFQIITKSSGAQEPEPKFYKADYSNMGDIKPMDGTYVANVVGLFRRPGRMDIDPVEAVAIRVDKDILTPKDGDSWELAKTYLVSAAAQNTLFVDHPSQAHFPMSVVNGYTKGVFPQDHVIFQLLEPHFYLHMGVNDSVRFFDNSVAMMEFPMLPFNCFTFEKKQNAFKFFEAGSKGIEGNSSFPKYEFTTTPRNIESVYGRFLRSLFPTTVEFIDELLPAKIHEDPYVHQWADHISKMLVGFPSAAEIKAGGRKFTVDVIAKIVWLSSIEHSTTHHSFGLLPLLKVPYRIRHKPPTREMADRKERVSYRSLTNWWDRAQTHLAHMMFFEDVPVLRLNNVDYKFSDPKQHDAANRFLNTVSRQIDEWGDFACIPYERIATSVQY